ncbi:MFS transporter [Altererythrobacter sp. SALINAS58]|uniref:MFS transporter n=1 Tax=Alteripontixanthobacter muriae TaxID=2705546 RepID=UPI00157577B5|nr:MFS transporter [Alteripontixanthobacter muriae]NTZ43188.1 MFS transporter [Alteripontixanthobacter muriae]
MTAASLTNRSSDEEGAFLEPQYTDGAPFRRYMLLLSLAAMSIAAVWGGLGNLIIPLHVQQIEFAQHFRGLDAAIDLQQLIGLKAQVGAGEVLPSSEQRRLLSLLDRFDAARAANLAFVISVGVFMTMLAQPIVGVLSDRTRSVRGRRGPWILGGAFVAAIGLVGIYLSATVAALALMWSVVQMATNAAMAPLQATVADRVPENRIGTVSGVTGLGAMLGLVLGAVVAGALFQRFGVASYLPFGFTLAVFCLLFVLLSRDRPSTHMTVAPITAVGYLRSFTIALRDSDYRWVWIAKVLLMFGFAVSTALTVYMLQSYISPALSAEEAAETAPLLLVAALPGILIAMFLSGRLSDRLAKRKPFVIASSLLFAASMAVPLIWPTLPALFAQTIVAGVALGAFLVVDQALFIDVLPDRECAGRDLGIAALGGNLGQALGPALAGVIIASTGSYRLIWLTGLIAVLLAALAILPVKKAK